MLTIILGAIVLAWPGPSILVASTLFAVYLLVAGFAQLFMAFILPRSAGTRVMLFISGALSLVLAILSFRHFGDAYAVLLLSLWIGISFIFQGVSESAIGISTRDLPGRGWYISLASSPSPASLCLSGCRFDRCACIRHRHLASHSRSDPDRAGLAGSQGRQRRARNHRLGVRPSGCPIAALTDDCVMTMTTAVRPLRRRHPKPPRMDRLMPTSVRSLNGSHSASGDPAPPRDSHVSQPLGCRRPRPRDHDEGVRRLSFVPAGHRS